MTLTGGIPENPRQRLVILQTQTLDIATAGNMVQFDVGDVTIATVEAESLGADGTWVVDLLGGIQRPYAGYSFGAIDNANLLLWNLDVSAAATMFCKVSTALAKGKIRLTIYGIDAT